MLALSESEKVPLVLQSTEDLSSGRRKQSTGNGQGELLPSHALK